MKASKIIFLGLVTFGTLAHAGSLVCSDVTGQRLTYSLSHPDGGAPIGPTENLVLDGEVLIKKSPFSPDAAVAKAWMSVGDKPKNTLIETKTKNWVSSAFVAKATVTATADDDERHGVLFDGFITCEQRKYVGVPIP